MKQAFITGASRGIGAGIAITLGARGYRVWLHYNTREDAARRVAAAIESAGGPAPLLVSFDLAQRDEAVGRVRALLESEGTPDALVLNAGIREEGLFVFTEDSAWDALFATNVTGGMAIARPVLKSMLRRRSGRVVMVSSVAAQRGSPGQVAYAATKGALVGVTRSLSLEVAARGITVNAVSPGLVETDMLKGAPLDALLSHVPMARVGTADEIGHVVAWLCSDDGAYVTGQVIGVNGGMWMGP